MRTSKIGLLLLCLTLGALSSALVQAAAANGANVAVPYPTAATPPASDLGALKDVSSTEPISVTVALALRDPDGAEKLLKAVSTPGNPQFRHFLSTEEFTARFAPEAADVAKVVATFAEYGLATERASATTLKVTGLPADMERAFGVSLHSYAVGGHDNAPGYSYHAPLNSPTVPAAISTWVAAVVGLDSRPTLRPRHKQAPPNLRRPKSLVPAVGGGLSFGFLTVSDFVNHYNAMPLVNQGITGNGRTLGIMTFAAFTPSDAFTYWGSLGLTVSPSRITIVNVDGGPGAPSDASGSDETTLDVEQSGGIAPGANIIVYQAPNTNQAFIDVIAAAVTANTAETISISWGGWEWFDTIGNSPVVDPISSQTVAAYTAFHEQLVQGGIQGQTFFAASGDGGAYDVNHDLNCFPPNCSNTLSADYPASDPAMTGAGGTTLPGMQSYCLNQACTPPFFNINLPNEQVWGWDYLRGLCDALGAHSVVKCGIFPGGGGGGVSVFFGVPSYQNGLAGVLTSPSGQAFTQFGTTYFVVPSGFPGRNVPDVSANADPQTGYVIFYTSDQVGFEVLTFFGGTSFVAPQLNGVSALLGEYLLGNRIGLLNTPLYMLAQNGTLYAKPNPPMKVIGYGDNWFYFGRNGYNPGAGLGILNVANLAASLKAMGF